MITSFRKFFQSRFGMAVFIGFLALVALAFAGADMTGTTFGGVVQGERVALVGDDEVTSNDLTSTAQSALRGVQRENPTVTMSSFVAEEGVDEVLDQMIDRYAIGAFAEMAGLRAGDNLVNSEILKIPAFRGLSGDFDQERYQRLLADQRITDAILRRDLADGLLSQQILLPALATPRMPEKAARQYAKLFLERREGQIALIPSSEFTNDDAPEQAALEEFYSENRAQYVEPERRTLRYAVFSADNLTDDLTPTSEEIAARYEADKEQYAARSTRDVTAFTVPTLEGAEAIVAAIRGGQSLEAAARDAGFNTTSVTDRDQEQYASSASFAAAQAVFAAEQGAVIDPAQTTLGYQIARVDKITNIPERSLAQVSGEIKQTLTAEKRARALGDLSARIEEEVDEGTSLLEIADSFDLTLEESAPLLADGRVFGEPGAQPNEALRPILDTAFQLDESQPQLDVLVPGQAFLVYDVTNIAESNAPPLASIRDRVVADFQLAQGSKLARKAAQRVLEKARGDSTLASAMSEEEQRLPPVDDVTLTRREVQQLRQRGAVPPAVALMFSMARGTIKLLEAPGKQGWILVSLSEITADELEDDSPIIEGTQRQLAQNLRDEYAEQLSSAMRDAVGVEINESALEEVKSKLAGGGS